MPAVAEPTTSAPTSSRREESKARTKRGLQKAALVLFARQGYDETTTEEIAEQANVSPRTFFRYFPTKESALFLGEEGWIENMTVTFRDRPDSLSDLEALKETLATLAPRFNQSRKAQIMYEKSVQSSPTLRGREHQQRDIAIVASAIAARRGLCTPDESCSLAASTALMAHRRALDTWLAGPASVDPAEVIREQFDNLGDLLAPRRGSRRS